MTAPPEPDFVIRAITPADRPAWLSLRQALWMGTDATTLAAESGRLLEEPERFGARAYAALLAWAQGRAVGFVEVSLRDDVPTFEGRLVGYVEGVYVAPVRQGSGLGRALILAAEGWVLERGAAELASDVLPDNPESLEFHTRLGFAAVGETNTGGRRQILLAKRLG